MNSDRWQQINQLFEAVLERGPGERAAFIEEACAGDESLRRELESLLAACDEVESFMEQPAIGQVAEMFAGPGSGLPAGKLLSHYKILSKLGAGGMGEVYLAEDARLRRKVALKILPESLAADKERLLRFEREAFAASALNHPNILTIHEFGADEGTHFLASEYVEGETLRERLKQGGLDAREAIEIAEQLASALAAAHQAGIVHRDVKPENIMLRPDRLVKVLDFGLAKAQTPSPSPPGGDPEEPTAPLLKTSPGLIMGTVHYMSPEQARGTDVDARTDVFSFGLVLYEMLAGRLPFEGETASDYIASVLKTEPRPLEGEGIPDELKRVVRKGLKKDRDARYQTMKGLLADLKDLREEISFSEKLERGLGLEHSRRAENQPAAAVAGGMAAVTAAGEETTKGGGGERAGAAATNFFTGGVKNHKRGLAVGAAVLLLAAMIGYAHGLAGDREKAIAARDEILRRSATKKVSPFALALVHAAVGDTEQTFAWLEKAYEQRDPDVRNLGTEVWFSHLSGDPRFRDLVRRIGLTTPN